MYEKNIIKDIELKDIGACLLYRWGTVFVSMILFAVIIGAALSYKDYRDIKGIQDLSGANYGKLTAEMTEEQISNAEQFYHRYDTYKARVDEAQKYYNDSLIMKINANAVSKYDVEYYVESGYSDIIESFCSSALDMDDYIQIAQILGEDSDPMYASELLEMSGSVTSESYDIDTDNGSVSQTYKGILHVTITSNDLASGEDIAQVVDAAIMEYLSKLNAVGIDASVSLLSTNYIKQIDNALAEYQHSKTEDFTLKIEDLNDLYESARGTLDKKELKLFEYWVNKATMKIDRIHWGKWILFGAVAGICVGVFWVVTGYIFSSQIRTISELKKIYPKQELGVVIAQDKTRGLVGKWFHKWAQDIELIGINRIKDGEAIEIIARRITNIMKAENNKKVFLLSDINDGYTKEVLEKSIELLRNNGIEAEAGNPLGSVKELDALCESDGAVMVSTIKRSFPDSVQNGLTICEENKVPVIGNFIVYQQV